jgi:hypothetical protein
MVGRFNRQAIPAPAPLASQPRPEMRKAGLLLRRVLESQELVRQHLDEPRITAAANVQRSAVVEAITQRVDLRAPGQYLAAVEARDG